jgi:hypothetical protein
VWVGYDNASGRRTLGRGQTGGKVAVPIFEPIIRAVWAQHAPQVALSPPSSDARRQLAALPIDLGSGNRVEMGGRGAFYEQFRVGRGGEFSDTQFNIVGRDEADTLRERDWFMRGDQDGYDRNRGVYGYGNQGYGSYGYGNGPMVQGPFGRPLPQGPLNPFRGLFGDQQQPQQRSYQSRSYDERYTDPSPPQSEELERARPRRVDPDYFWGRRYN